MNGPYKHTYKQALTTIRKRWGARITWLLQREHAAQIIKAQKDLARYQKTSEEGAAAAARPSLADLDQLFNRLYRTRPIRSLIVMFPT